MTVRARSALALAVFVASLVVISAGPAGAGVTCSISVNDVAVLEGDGGTTQLVFTVTRSGSAVPIELDIFTFDSTASGGSDYVPRSQRVLTTTTTTFSVTVNGDTLPESDEILLLNISVPFPGPCVITDNQGIGTITNDDVVVVDPLVPAGYRLTSLDGGVFAFGQSTYLGSANTLGPNAPIVDIDETFNRSGYWQVGADGGVFAWGAAPFFGSAAPFPLEAPVLGIAARPQNDGYWLVSLDGGVFAFGGAPFLGNAFSPGAAVVDIVPTPSGGGYWLLDAGGAVHAFGDAAHLGSYDARDVEAVGMAASSTGAGYWIANVAGNVLPFGSVASHGQISDPESLAGSTTGIEATASGNGYWLVATDGGVFAFGDAPFYGSLGGLELDAPVVAMAGRR
jgi:hypothetical protein